MRPHPVTHSKRCSSDASQSDKIRIRSECQDKKFLVALAPNEQRGVRGTHARGSGGMPDRYTRNGIRLGYHPSRLGAQKRC